MDDSRKLINWVAGIATLIAALLIVIVVLEPKEGGVSRAAASRTVALTIASGDMPDMWRTDKANFALALEGDMLMDDIMIHIAEGETFDETLKGRKKIYRISGKEEEQEENGK